MPFFSFLGHILQDFATNIYANKLEYLYIKEYVSPKQHLKKNRSRRSEVFYKKGVLRNFAKFTGKHLCLKLFF